jgi:protocatechuate 3,4-dioxygenase beta subunit
MSISPTTLPRLSPMRLLRAGAVVLLLAGAGCGFPGVQAQQAQDAPVQAEAPAQDAAEAPAQAPAVESSAAPEAGAAVEAPPPAAPTVPVPVSLALTPAQTEGPYFKSGSPQRDSLLEPEMAGTRLIITGRVLTPDGTPVASAKLDFWQADDRGAYDNAGYRLRGHLFTDGSGMYRLETIVPGLYPGRTRHIHVKVQAPGGPVLTTQLYLPDEPGNTRDGIYNPALLMTVQERTPDRILAWFDFIVAA